MINNKLLGLVYIDNDGMNIWIKDANFYSRNMVPMQVVCTDDSNSAKQDIAKGKHLRISFKDFKPYLISNFTKNNDRNEITFYLNEERARRLKRFLNEMFP